MKAPSEAAVLRECLNFLALHKIMAWRSSNHAVKRVDRKGRTFHAFHGLRGVSDIIAVLGPHADHPGGRMLCLEVKGPKGKLSPEQAIFLDVIRSFGGLALVVRSSKELEDALRSEGAIP